MSKNAKNKLKQQQHISQQRNLLTKKLDKWKRGLHAGDQVTWNDPDDGLCTKTITISSIEIVGDVAKITDTNGDYLECLLSELS